MDELNTFFTKTIIFTIIKTGNLMLAPGSLKQHMNHSAGVHCTFVLLSDDEQDEGQQLQQFLLAR